MSDSEHKYYRFRTGTFIKAKSFEEAKAKYVRRLERETEDESNWHECACTGFSHSHNCPQHVMCL